MLEENPVHWADIVVKKIIAEKGNKAKYVCAAGITPSGTVHIGNFREIITVEFVVRALQRAGKKTRFIYSWDDYDVFRKVPKNMPKQDMLKDNLRKPIVDISDPFDKEESYARHHEVEVEESVAKVGIFPEYLYQAKKYRNLEYVEGMKKALKNADLIRSILDKYRTEPLSEDWLPISGYCPECNKDEVTFSNYDGKYKIKMHCETCNSDLDVDIKKAPFLKLPWRVDWPMRWAHEKVDFEPGGKDHSTEGGSFSTGKEIVKIYDWTAPSYQRYDFIKIKGGGGKISSSSGDVITLGDCLEIYEPEIVRYMFAGSRPNAEFAISFDLDVIKMYEDFDKVERIYFGIETANEKETAKNKRVYELSVVEKVPKKMPIQPTFRHITNILQAHEMDIDAVIKYFGKEVKDNFDKERIKVRSKCAKNWLENYAPEDFKFSVQKSVPKGIKIPKEIKQALKEFGSELESKDWKNDKELHEFFYKFMKVDRDISPQNAFKAAYQVIINKEKGPMLASFILTLGKDRVAKLFKSL